MLTWLALKNIIRGPTLSEKDRHLCMRDERLWRDTCQNFVTSEQCRVSRPQFLQSTHGTPGTMTPLLARKTVAFYDSGFPTEARVIKQAFRSVNEQRSSQIANQIFCFQIKRGALDGAIMAQFFLDYVIIKITGAQN